MRLLTPSVAGLKESKMRGFIAIVILAGLVACGGGGGSSAETLPEKPTVQNEWDSMEWEKGEWQ